MLRSSLSILLVLATCACSEEIGEAGQIVLVQGPDDDAWTAEPAPISADVEKVLEDGTRHLQMSAPAPLERFSLGRGSIGSYVVTGKDGAEVARARALSLAIDPAGFAGSVLSLFVARSERFSRPPGALSVAQGEHPPAAVVAGRYLFFAGGGTESRVETDAYDLGGWSATPSSPNVTCPSTPCRFRSLAVVAGTLVLAVGDSWAISFDIDLGTSNDAPLPTGLPSWADVAGGRTVTATDGTAFVVGATRRDAPSQWVIEISPTGELFARALITARQGASAAWVEGRGLVVVGGNTNDTDAGVEVLAIGGQAFQQLLFPADRTVGAGLAVLDPATVVRAGGRDGTGDPAASVEIALGCGTGCAPTPRSELVALDDVAGFALGEGELLFVGDDASGETAALRLGKDGLTPVALREPRKGGTALRAPTGHVAVGGGVHADGSAALSLELFSL